MKNRHKKRMTGIILAIAVVLAGYAGYDFASEQMGNATTGNRVADTVATGDMKVTFLDVGQGDCTIIQTEDQAMMIDAGDNHAGASVVDYLEAEGIEKLDYLILTHPDSDHIGGGDDVLENLEVDTVLMPDVSNNTMTYEEVIRDIETYEVEVIHPSVGDTYTLGDAEFTILCPDASLISQEDTNNASVGVKLVHGSNSFVMCGDAETASESAMITQFGSSLDCDVLKCGHHGSSTSTSDAFLKATDPTWAVISCGVDNDYGHPHREVLEKLKNDDVQIYRTDQMGTIIATSDGNEISWTTEE
jgi:competence protein ComEC